MLNSAPINSWPLNALDFGAMPSDPIVIDPPEPPNPPLPPVPPAPGKGVYPGFPVPPSPNGHSFRWSAFITLGGIDVTSLLTGGVRVDREEGASGVAEIRLFYPVGTPVQSDMENRTLTIDYITDDGHGSVQTRIFTGLVAEPRWDAPSRVMSITATDNLQQRVEAMTENQVAELTQGHWTADVFSELDGRSRWDYAQERMSSRAASLDCTVIGDLRTTTWYAKQAPDYVFASGTSIYQSVVVDLAQARSVTNRVEMNVSYRYSRLNEAQIKFSWANTPSSFCSWIEKTSELPNVEMFMGAVSGSGVVPVKTSWSILPPSMAQPCGKSAAWINYYNDLLLSGSVTGMKRWSQAVTEKYSLILTTEAGKIEGQQVISRSSSSFEIESADADGWSDSLVAVSSAPRAQESQTDHGAAGDRDDETRRLQAIRCMLQIANAEIIAAHRKTLVSWSAPTSMTLDIDLSHTVEINDQNTNARGKCSHRIDELDFDSGSAITTLTISVMRGGGESDSLDIPARLGSADNINDIPGWNITKTLPTQIGGSSSSGAYDDEKEGFSGNYSTMTGGTESFPRRMLVKAPEIDELYTDERKHETEVIYSIGIPNDLLEL